MFTNNTIRNTSESFIYCRRRALWARVKYGWRAPLFMLNKEDV